MRTKGIMKISNRPRLFSKLGVASRGYVDSNAPPSRLVVNFLMTKNKCQVAKKCYLHIVKRVLLINEERFVNNLVGKSHLKWANPSHSIFTFPTNLSFLVIVGFIRQFIGNLLSSNSHRKFIVVKFYLKCL